LNSHQIYKEEKKKEKGRKIKRGKIIIPGRKIRGKLELCEVPPKRCQE
jgi:hypothetical protein